MAEAFAKAVADNHGTLDDSLQSELDKMMSSDSQGPSGTQEGVATPGETLKDDTPKRGSPCGKPEEEAAQPSESGLPPGQASQNGLAPRQPSENGPAPDAVKEEPQSPLPPPPPEQSVMVECMKCGEVRDAKNARKNHGNTSAIHAIQQRASSRKQSAGDLTQRRLEISQKMTKDNSGKILQALRKKIW